MRVSLHRTNPMGQDVRVQLMDGLAEGYRHVDCKLVVVRSAIHAGLASEVEWEASGELRGSVSWSVSVVWRGIQSMVLWRPRSAMPGFTVVTCLKYRWPPQVMAMGKRTRIISLLGDNWPPRAAPLMAVIMSLVHCAITAGLLCTRHCDTESTRHRRNRRTAGGANHPRLTLGGYGYLTAQHLLRLGTELDVVMRRDRENHYRTSVTCEIYESLDVFRGTQ